ncbi:hypothetical protein AbraIFM66951_000791 [Aspergillus brasiliensis]|uniref:C2H2-type domain-containing protein n=2 Tax=Aspergillus brasiliensis TaxID=319629 RepID=A0A9W5YZW6_9EURO|nr:hypothetical protein AbraCBS73388_001619 [Aspergillus brasiliensis]GKZ48707.1 hypothetical protein AbraIFM66951_000791 [Aspergillus brasiliensis]
MASTLPRGRRRQRKTSPKERICPVCSQAFKKAEHLARHFRSHTKERPFPCPICGKLYVRRDTLLRHTRSQHPESELPEPPSNEWTSDLAPEPVALEQPTTGSSTDVTGAYPLILTGLHDLQYPSLTHDAHSVTTSLSTQSLDHTASTPAPNICEYGDDLVAGFFATEMTGTRAWPTFWSGQWDEGWTSLLTAADFDLDAINQTLLESTDQRPQNLTPQPASISPAPESLPDATTGLTAVQRRWHTFSETKLPSQRASPEPLSGGTTGPLRTHADDRYRQKLVESLRPPVQVGILPSTSFLWARKVRLFVFDEDPLGDVQSLEDDSDALRLTWKNWARLEERKRIVLALHIHDAEFAKLHHHEPILRHAPENLPQLSAPELFAAPCAKSWKALYLRTKPRFQGTHLPVTGGRSSLLREFPQNDFLSYAMLESIGALASEDRSRGPSGRAVVRQCEELLMEWYCKYAHVSNASKHPDHFCLLILWHSIFMHLDTGFDQLECACGRDGDAAAQKSRPYASSWAESRAATRALLHATCIHQHFQLLPIGAEPAIHVPMALYHCGIAWACFTRFGSGVGDSLVDPATLSEFPEIKLFGAKQLKSFHDIRSNLQWGKSECGPMLKTIDLLGKISHWKVAGSFATTLMALVDTQDFFFDQL